MDKNRWNLNKTQRMQLKALICLLGLLLLLILSAVRVIMMLADRDREEPPEPEVHIPVVELHTNVWIMEADEEGLMIFRDGAGERCPWGTVTGQDGTERSYREETDPSGLREQVADVELTDGAVTFVSAKTDKINGKILSAGDDRIEVEGYGVLPLAADYKGYRLFDSLQMCTVNDLYFGYNYTDLCMEEGEVCGILMVKEEAMEYIRVLIKTSDFGGIFHESPVLTCNTGFTVIYGSYDNRKEEHHEAWEDVTFAWDGDYFEADRVLLVPDVLTGRVVFRNCNRALGTPAYRGGMELLLTEDGIVVVNEVLMEEYLYSVVPSEMPSTYAPEALKAQAVCARTYAYGRMLHAGYPQYGAHVDDSTSYQVYNNGAEDEGTTTAVKETYGKLLLTSAGEPAETFYYSTSCGVGTDATVWKTEAAPKLTYLRPKLLNRNAMKAELEGRQTDGSFAERLKEEEAFAEFITSVNPEDFEAEQGWYRWSYRVEETDPEHMLQVMQRRYAANGSLILTWKDGEYVSEEISKLDDITDMYIEKRGGGGVADELVIGTKTQKFKVISEYNIRAVLNDGKTTVMRQDGSEISGSSLLPSGFFIMETEKEDGLVTGYALTGGGFGHGVGMSQNGAGVMAGEGYSAEDILLYFYEDCIIENIYEQEQ